MNKLYVSGKWINGNSEETFTSINPADERILGYIQKGNERDVRTAIDAAEDAFPKWSDAPAPERAKILYKVVELLQKNKNKLGKLVTMEMGKVLPEALGDVQEAIDIFEYMAAEGRRLFGHTTTSELPAKFAMTVKMPVGVCGLITPWNFPIAIPAWKLAPALICGNTVVIKPSSDTPLCVVELVKILEKAGLPKGVVNLVTGPARTVGQEIVRNKKTRMISFTGSKETGEWVLKNAGLKKVGLELGGKNPIIVMDDANIPLAVEGILWGAFGTTGQRCTACSRVIVHKKIKKKLENALVHQAKRMKLGNGLLKTTDVGPLINKSALKKTEDYVGIAKEEEGKMLCGGETKKGKGFFYKPTIFSDIERGMRLAQEEVFGPVLAILETESLEQAIEIANDVEYGLSSAIYTERINDSFNAIKKLETGLTYVNSSTIGSEVHLPFGGVKGTGFTREAGIEGIEEFSHTKTVYFDYSGKLQKAQIDVE